MAVARRHPDAGPGTHHPGRRHRLVRAAGFAVALGLPVIVLAFVVRTQVPSVVAFDEAAIARATSITRSEPALRGALLTWQEVFRAGWVNLAVTGACLWAWRRHGLRTRALWGFTTLMVAWGLQLLAKQVVQRARPVVEDAVAQAPGYSFPSGHAANTAAAAVVLTVVVWPLLRARGRVLVPAVAGLAVLVTALDRVFLGVHYPSDVVAGVLFGAAVTGASFAGYVGDTPRVTHHEATDHRPDHASDPLVDPLHDAAGRTPDHRPGG